MDDPRGMNNDHEMVAEAVQRNRSPLNISLFSGKLTGKFAIFWVLEALHIGEAPVPQRFFTKFPKTINRVKLSDNRDRNRVNSEIQSGYQKRPFLTHGSRWRRRHARRRRTACDRQDRQRDARSCECLPGFESSASAGLELAAVSADEIFLAECTAFAAAVKRQPPKHSKEVTRSFNPTIGKHW
jgi:hypothetical protein